MVGLLDNSKISRCVFKIAFLSFFSLISLWVNQSFALYEDDESTARHIQRKVSMEDYQEFLKLKKGYYGAPFLEQVRSGPKGAHFYQVMRDDGGLFYILGTDHQLPMEILPECVLQKLQYASHVYVESDPVELYESMFLFGQSKETSAEIPLEKFPSLELHLRLYLKRIWQKEIMTNLKLESIYLLSEHTDCYGIDVEVIMIALLNDKKLLALDLTPRAEDLFAEILDEDMKWCQERASQSEAPQKDIRKLQNQLRNSTNSRENHMKIRIELALLEFESCELREKELLSLCEDYSTTELPILDEICDDEEYNGSDHMKSRNIRWVRLLEEAVSGSFVCVGADHLPELFETWQTKGYTVTKVDEYLAENRTIE